MTDLDARVRAIAEGNFSRVIGRDGDIMDKQKL
jgi:hypothetical protein